MFGIFCGQFLFEAELSGWQRAKAVMAFLTFLFLSSRHFHIQGLQDLSSPSFLRKIIVGLAVLSKILSLKFSVFSWWYSFVFIVLLDGFVAYSALFQALHSSCKPVGILTWPFPS